MILSQIGLLPHERGEAEPLIAEHHPEHLSVAQDDITHVTLAVTADGDGSRVAVQLLEDSKVTTIHISLSNTKL